MRRLPAGLILGARAAGRRVPAFAASAPKPTPKPDAARGRGEACRSESADIPAAARPDAGRAAAGCRPPANAGRISALGARSRFRYRRSCLRRLPARALPDGVPAGPRTGAARRSGLAVAGRSALSRRARHQAERQGRGRLVPAGGARRRSGCAIAARPPLSRRARRSEGQGQGGRRLRAGGEMGRSRRALQSRADLSRRRGAARAIP